MKYIFKVAFMFIGYIGFSQQGSINNRQAVQVTFPNGDESIVITTGKRSNVLKLTTNSQTNRFEGLELSNHEVVHQKELPEFNPGLDSLVGRKEAYSYSQEEDEKRKSKNATVPAVRKKDS